MTDRAHSALTISLLADAVHAKALSEALDNRPALKHYDFPAMYWEAVEVVLQRLAKAYEAARMDEWCALMIELVRGELRHRALPIGHRINLVDATCVVGDLARSTPDIVAPRP